MKISSYFELCTQSVTYYPELLRKAGDISEALQGAAWQN